MGRPGPVDTKIGDPVDEINDLSGPYNLPEDQGFGKYTEHNYRSSLIKSDGGVNPGKDVHAHHVFPEEFAKVFERKGINIHHPRNMAWWSIQDGHLVKAYAYNQEWAKVIGGNAWQSMTTQQIYMEGVRIMNMFHPAGMNPNICLPIRYKGF